MDNNVGSNLHELFEKMENFISTKTVVGDAVNFGDTIIVPLVEVSLGAGTGLGQKKEELQSGGGGFGAKLSPVAVVVIVNETVQLINVKDQESVNKLIDMIPGILSKFNLDSLFSKKSDKEKEDTADQI